jgi:hypothetical protein
MKVYQADEDAERIEAIRLWGFNVTGKATKASVWLGAAKCGLEIGLGFVDLVRTSKGYIVSTDTRRYYGPVLIKFKEAKK